MRIMENCDFDFTIRAATLLIGSQQRSGRCRKAMEIFEAMSCPKMAARGIEPNFYTYSSLISVCCAAGACSKALQAFQAMRDAGKLHGTPEVDKDLFKRLILACYKDGRMSDVLSLYQLLLDNELPSDEEMELCVLEAHAEMGDWEEAVQCMDRLHREGTEIPARSYSRFLAACASHENLSMTVEVFLSMQMVGVEPSPADCHHVICVAAARKDVETCVELIEEMQIAGIEISPATCACLSPILGREYTRRWEHGRGRVIHCRKGAPAPHMRGNHGYRSWCMSGAQVGGA